MHPTEVFINMGVGLTFLALAIFLLLLAVSLVAIALFALTKRKQQIFHLQKEQKAEALFQEKAKEAAERTEQRARIGQVTGR